MNMSSKETNNIAKNSCISVFHNGLADLIKKVFKGDVVLDNVDTAFDYAIRQSNGELKFPFISLYPSPNIEISSLNNNFVAIKDGAPMMEKVPIYDDYGKYKGTTNKVSKNVKNLYINIEYQIDIWAINRQMVEEVTQELLFWLFENREVSINYYGRELLFTFIIGDNIVDNSDLINYETSNKIYRMTLNVIVTGSIFRTENYFNVLDTKIDINYLENKEV